MFETKEQKKYFIISAVVVLGLIAVMLLQRANFRYYDSTDYIKKQQDAKAASEAYAKYLSNIETDPKASQELFQTILTQEDIRQEVENQLKPDQPIVIPSVEDKNLNISEGEGESAVESYIYNGVGPAVTFSQATTDLNKQLFKGSATAEETLQVQYAQAFRQILNAPVPKEATTVHKSLVAAYMSYGNMLELSRQHTAGQNSEPWADLYHDYAAMNQSFKSFSDGLGKLAGKYHIAENKMTFPSDLAAYDSGHTRFSVVPQARALFGFGDVTITIGDIPRIVMDAVKEGLVSSFSQFMASFLDKMIQKIESNYVIANFLYYSDALVRGQYADDYLKKYVGDPLDRQLVKQFIPQFSCNLQNQSLKPIFQAKANQYLGFDPASLSPADPDYYTKLARAGNFFSSPEGWQMYYQDLASQAESEAQRSIDRELTSPGLKTPRNSLSVSITSSINSIVGAERAGLLAILQLGINNAESVISSFVAQITQTLFTKFVFNGASVSPRGNAVIGVLKEQTTCLAAAQLTPIVPINGTPYQQPPPTPDAGDVVNDICTEFPQACPRPTSP